MRNAPLTVVVALVIATLASAAGAQTAAAAKIRNDVPPLVLELPPSGRATGELIQRLLTSAAVPFGLEQAPETPDAAPFDPGQERPQSVTLSGLTVGAALDRIAGLDPRYGWEEAGGRIIVRAASLHGAGVLGLQIDGLPLRGATLGDALLTLMRAIDPNRPEGGLLNFGLRASVGPVGAVQGTVAKPRLNLSLGRTTVFEALNALAQTAGVSWALRYELPDANPESVAITLLGNRNSGGGLAALSSRMLRAGSDPASRSRIRVFAAPSVTSAYDIYAQRAKVQIGVELPPEPIGTRRAGGPGLDLTDVPAADAIDRITRLDSRLTWTVADGIFSVRPRPDLVPTSPLDTMVESFVAQDETVEAILGRIAMLFGGRVTGNGSGGGGRLEFPDEQQARKSLARALSFRLERTTIRAVLDTLCRTQGSLSWRVIPMEQPTTGILLSLQVGSWDSWSVSRSIQLVKW